LLSSEGTSVKERKSSVSFFAAYPEILFPLVVRCRKVLESCCNFLQLFIAEHPPGKIRLFSCHSVFVFASPTHSDEKRCGNYLLNKLKNQLHKRGINQIGSLDLLFSLLVLFFSRRSPISIWTFCCSGKESFSKI
jgi:hypothetical protein